MYVIHSIELYSKHNYLFAGTTWLLVNFLGIFYQHGVIVQHYNPL